MKKSITFSVVETKYRDSAFSREAISWCIRIDFGRGNIFLGLKSYKSIDSAYRALARFEKSHF